MNRVLLLVAALSLALGSGCAIQPIAAPAAEPKVELQRLEQRQDAFLDALSTRDLEQVLGHFDDDALVHIANMPPIGGRDAIAQFYGNVFRFLRSAGYRPDFIRVSDCGQFAYSAGSVTTVFDGREGPVEYAGKFLLVWVKRDHEWFATAYSISNNSQ
jgi:ketosteroid isomerase-like protein